MLEHLCTVDIDFRILVGAGKEEVLIFPIRESLGDRDLPAIPAVAGVVRKSLAVPAFLKIVANLRPLTVVGIRRIPFLLDTHIIGVGGELP